MRIWKGFSVCGRLTVARLGLESEDDMRFTCFLAEELQGYRLDVCLFVRVNLGSTLV